MTKNSNSSYQWVEKNISKIGPSTYRIRVGCHDGYATSKEQARKIRAAFRNK